TCDLWVMSPTSYRTAPPRVTLRKPRCYHSRGASRSTARPSTSQGGTSANLRRLESKRKNCSGIVPRRPVVDRHEDRLPICADRNVPVSIARLEILNRLANRLRAIGAQLGPED